MKIVLYACAGGNIVLPAQGSALMDRRDGGNLVIDPPRPVWERSALSVAELTAWTYLVAAAGEAMLALPQLQAGCINYWEAGNWALNYAAQPQGPKTAPAYRKMHLHLIGRNPRSHAPDCAWGESPVFPRYSEKETWGKDKQLLTPDECSDVVTRTEILLRDKFAMPDLRGWRRCETCSYPTPDKPQHVCS